MEIRVTAGGKVLARKDEDSRVLRISSSDDLAKMNIASANYKLAFSLL